MMQSSKSSIQDLPPEARKRAQAFVEEGDYYGWQLMAVATRPIGNMLQCTLDFDNTTIVFLAQGADYAEAVPQQRATLLH
jgi:hypothetical protein